MGYFEYFLLVVGFVVLVNISFMGLRLIACFISNLSYNIKYAYKYKHRFDKKPTAKCYCIDCKYHDNEVGFCHRFEKEQRRTADNWFCWDATPRKKEEVEKQ